PHLEMAEIHRRVYSAGGPALYFSQVKGSPFPAVSNLYGTFERTEYLFRDTLNKVQQVVALKADPSLALKSPVRGIKAGLTALTGLPRRRRAAGGVTFGRTTIDKLPQIVSWPMDGGAFITLPQVLTMSPGDKSMMRSNLGMYRIQLSGNDYAPGEIGMHYQIHRGIGVHHAQYNASDQPFKASIFVGGPPSHAFAAIMPLPEGLSELTFAGMLAGRRFRYAFHQGHVLSLDADFCITGTILKDVKKPEGPFGDHLGYYSLAHDFPVMRVEQVYHRKDPIWHFTVVGRPPQEDTSFGHLIHEIVGPLLGQEFPGLHEVNAVDAAGVHPLLLAIGSERYMPFRERRPEEILTIANHLLGKGQTSLAKYLIISAKGDDASVSTHDIGRFLHHVLERVDLRRDLHFQTQTTIDTLDYSGTGWNAGSKLVIAACGPPQRTLSTELPADLRLPEGFTAPGIWRPGVMTLEGPRFTDYPEAITGMDALTNQLSRYDLSGIPLIVVCDDSAFCQATLNNFLWVTFTRSNPSHDVYGVGAFTKFKHWGCTGPMIIDARIKPHHAPVLETDPEVDRRVDALMQQIDVLRPFA
ncbi:MAG: UbiD family decarboxylase, partial [Saprospiraceae bacterium]|nr:UbiD family decarboxylase [Saprospiraceae bacterium]